MYDTSSMDDEESAAGQQVAISPSRSPSAASSEGGVFSIIHPDTKWREWWDYFVMMLILCRPGWPPNTKQLLSWRPKAIHA